MNAVTETKPNSSTPGATNPASAVWLVADREIRAKLGSKAFLISTGILLLIVLVGILIGGFTSKNPGETKVAAVAEAVAPLKLLPNVDVTEADDRASAEELVRSGEVEAAVLPGGSPNGYTVVGLSEAPSSIVEALSQRPAIQLLEPASTNPVLRYLIAFGFGLVFLIAATTFGGTIAQNVVEEKQTRVVEVLLSVIPARTLLAGKVIGNTVLAMAQIVAIVTIATVSLIVTDQREVLTTLGSPLIWFAVFFLFGFVLLAALFAATASMVSRQEDMASATMPVTLLVMAPYVMVIIFFNNPLILTIMSYVPFSAPVGMAMRLFVGEAQWWEPLISLGILLATAIAAILIAAKIYENSLLRMGGRVKLAEALRA